MPVGQAAMHGASSQYRQRAASTAASDGEIERLGVGQVPFQAVFGELHGSTLAGCGEVRGLASDEATGALLCRERLSVPQGPAADDRAGDASADLEALEDAAIGLRVMRPGAQRAPSPGVEEHQIGVHADRDRALLRQPEDPGGRGAAELDHPGEVEASAEHAVRVQQQ